MRQRLSATAGLGPTSGGDRSAGCDALVTETSGSLFHRNAVALAGPVLFVGVVLALGVFRYGALLPYDRRVLASTVLGLSVVWVTASLVLPSASPWPVPSARSAVQARTILPLLAVLAAWTLLSALWSPFPSRSLWAGLVIAEGITAFAAGTRLWGRTVEGVPLLVALLAAVGAVISWASLVGFGLGWDGYVGVLEAVGHAQGPFGYANALASSIVLTLPSTVWILVWSSVPLSMRSLAAGSAGLQAWALTLTHSRGAVVAIVGAVALIATIVIWRAVMRVGRRPLRRGLAVALGISLAVIVVATVALVWRAAEPYVRGPDIAPVTESGVAAERMEGSVTRPMTSDAYRLKTWAAAIEAIGDRPVLGWGADTFYEAYSQYKPGGKTRFAHNALVQHGVELGLVGVVALMAVIAAVAMLSARVALACRFPREPAPWVCASLLAFLIQNLVDLVWYMPSLFLLYWLCVGGAAAFIDMRAAGVRPKGR